MTRRIVFPSLSILILAAAPLHAGDAPPKGEKYAFLVGCGEYAAGAIPNVECTVEDVTDFADVLRESGWSDGHIVLMCDGQPERFRPEGKKILKELRLQLAGVGADDFVVVGLSGHGVKFKDEDHGYFCPSDARPGDKDTLVSLADLYNLLGACMARRKLMVINACRCDALPGLDLLGLAGFLTKPEDVPKGVAVMFSCAAGQVSWADGRLRHSVFFHYVLQGWEGDANPAGPVTLDDLVRYVRTQTKKYARAKLAEDQAPAFIGEGCGDWALADGGPPPEAEAKAAAAVEGLGGTVARDEHRPGRPVVEASLSFTKVADADLEALAGLRRVQTLLLSYSAVTDAGLKHLAPLRGLRTLYLNDTKVTDAGLRDLAELKGLQKLYLGDTGVTDAGLKELAALKGLQALKIHSTSVTEAGVKSLRAALPKLDIDY